MVHLRCPHRREGDSLSRVRELIESTSMCPAKGFCGRPPRTTRRGARVKGALIFSPNVAPFLVSGRRWTHVSCFGSSFLRLGPSRQSCLCCNLPAGVLGFIHAPSSGRGRVRRATVFRGPPRLSAFPHFVRSERRLRTRGRAGIVSCPQSIEFSVAYRQARR